MIQDFDIDLMNRKIKEWITGYLFTTAIVNSVDSSGCSVIFAGDSQATRKRYQRLSSAVLAVGDRVFMVRTGGTYIILGKVI